MYCSNCGKEVVGGNFCDSCGTKVVSDNISNIDSKKVTLTVTREKKTMGFAIPFPIYVDGVKIGDAKNGMSLNYDLSYGKHKVVIKAVEKDAEQEIEVNDQHQGVEIIFCAKMGFLAARASIKEVKYK